MKTYDFTTGADPPARPSAPVRTAADVEDGWKAYERWLERLRDQVNEKESAAPPELKL